MTGYFSPRGKSISLDEWVAAYRTGGRRVGKTELKMDERKILVSTLWLGIDHSFGDGPLLIYETMIFIEDANSEQMDRYSTYEQAWTAHQYIVGRLLSEGANVISNTRDLIL